METEKPLASLSVKKERESDEEEYTGEEEGTHIQGIRKSFLPVTCGTKMGIMDVEKLKRDKMCIKCDGSWYTTSGFEKFAGKGSNKKWKVSILHDGKPLQFWLETGLLFKQGYTRKRKNPVKKSILESNTKLWKLEKGFDKPNRTYVPKKESDEESTGKSPTRVRGFISSRETSDEDTSDEEAENVSKSNGDERNCHDTRFLPPIPLNFDDCETTDDEKTGEELVVTKPVPKIRRICSESDNSEGSSASENVDPITSQYLSVIEDHICEPPSIDFNAHSPDVSSPEPESPARSESSSHSAAQHMKKEDQSRSGLSAGSGANTADLLQLKREKIQLELKVLKIREEYYSLKVKELQTKCALK